MVVADVAAAASDKGGCLLQLGPLFRATPRFRSLAAPFQRGGEGENAFRIPRSVISVSSSGQKWAALCVMAVAFSQYSRDLDFINTTQAGDILHDYAQIGTTFFVKVA